MTGAAIPASIYFFMPVGRISLSHALIGGATACLLWEIIRHGLAWYFATLSQVNVMCGSLTTAIIVLLSLEIAAALLLLGAQVIAEHEGIAKGDADRCGGRQCGEGCLTRKGDEVTK